MYILTHLGYPVTLHRSYTNAESMRNWFIENTHMEPDNLLIKFMVPNDDQEPEYVN